MKRDWWLLYYVELVLWERCVISANNAQLFTDKIRHVTCARWRGSSARPSASRDNFSSADTTLLYIVSEKIDLVAVLDRLKCVVILLREVIQFCLSLFKMAVGAKRATREKSDHQPRNFNCTCSVSPITQQIWFPSHLIQALDWLNDGKIVIQKSASSVIGYIKNCFHESTYSNFWY